ncbi:MAG: hypothetical protein AAGM84_05295 [Pseudomonadota bacterium]
MTIIHLRAPHARLTLQQRAGPLLRSVSAARRFGDDVFWLKENAELLNILECTGVRPEAADLSTYELLYEGLPERLSFFPQYYRFLLSICLDLEDLGMPGTHGAALAEWAGAQGLAGAELSDLQRAEAHRLLARRGVLAAQDDGLDERLRAFMRRSATFALPNKKAAYELTHIVFYLSEYGRRAPKLDEGALVSLEYAGLLAFLDQNADLLAEICIALRYAGQTPSPIWESFVLDGLRGFTVTGGEGIDVADDYHEYMVSQWLAALALPDLRAAPIPEGRCRFDAPAHVPGPLRDMSVCLMQMTHSRSADWDCMRPILLNGAPDGSAQIVAAAEASSDRFGAFFEGFARALPAGR